MIINIINTITSVVLAVIVIAILIIVIIVIRYHTWTENTSWSVLHVSVFAHRLLITFMKLLFQQWQQT